MEHSSATSSIVASIFEILEALYVFFFPAAQSVIPSLQLNYKK